jgi:hypothetical protein
MIFSNTYSEGKERRLIVTKNGFEFEVCSSKSEAEQIANVAVKRSLDRGRKAQRG